MAVVSSRNKCDPFSGEKLVKCIMNKRKIDHNSYEQNPWKSVIVIKRQDNKKKKNCDFR